MRLTPHDIAKMLDHSTLQPFLTDEDIRKGCELALRYDTASVCARPCDMPLVASLLRGSDVKVCTVIGFPHGTHRTAIKVAEAKQALADGCTELDMVINIGKLLGGDEDYVRDEIRQIVQVAHEAGALVKVILETCYLTDAQKVTACHLSEEAGADFVKTSTGYGTKGCTIQDLQLMRRSVSERVQVKGSGGIRDLDTVLSARAVGATRCGVSATAAIMAEAEKRYAEGTLQEIDALKDMRQAPRAGCCALSWQNECTSSKFTLVTILMQRAQGRMLCAPKRLGRFDKLKGNCYNKHAFP